MKQPPVAPNVNGLLFFLKDASTHFTAEEQSAISQSAAGQRLKHSYDQCSGHSKQLQNARLQYKGKLQQMKTSEVNQESWRAELVELKRKIQAYEGKYVECLTYMTCPNEWRRYSQCWAESANLIDMQSHKSNGTLDWICRSERNTVEHCVGNTVTYAIMAGDLSS